MNEDKGREPPKKLRIRHLGVIPLLRNAPIYLYYLTRCFFIFKNPLQFVLCYIHRSPPASRIVEMRSGLKIALSEHPEDIVTVFVIIVKEDYGLIKKGGVVIDIGSNIGVFSLYAANSGARKIFSYEPNDKSISTLQRSINLNNLEKVITPNKLAVTGRSGDVLKIPLDSSPHNRIVAADAVGAYAQVNTTSLGNILEENEINEVDLLKIDCEGAEYEILFNTKDLDFAKIRQIRMEVHEGPSDKLIDFLKSMGFFIVIYNKSGAMLWMENSRFKPAR